MPEPIAALHERYVVRALPLPRHVERTLAADPRAGARAVLDAVRRRRAANRAEARRLRELLAFERTWRERGCSRIAGVDEAGMGPMAGPIVAGAVILPARAAIRGIDDSKRLDERTREALAPEIREVAIAWGVGVVEVDEIDAIGLHRGRLVAMTRALDAMCVAPDAALIDGIFAPTIACPVETIVKGDQRSMSIAAASILAKTHRDRTMIELDRVYPGYGFARHKGYPVADHRDAVLELGPSPIHRRCFAIVRQAIASRPSGHPQPVPMSPSD